MLDIQYCMYEGICVFFLVVFYKSRLKMWQGLKRLFSVLGYVGKESCFVIFGYVQGYEWSLLVFMDEGNENFKVNLEEVVEVVCIIKQLILGRIIEFQDVVVFMFYNVQVFEISKVFW